MAYPGPPGVSSKPSHPSLPPRPPTSKLGAEFKPAFQPTPSYPTTSSPPGYATSSSSYSSAPSYRPHHGASAPGTSYSYGQPAAAPIDRSRGYGAPSTSAYSAATTVSQPTYYGASNTAASTGAYSTPPQIRNPFPVPAGQAAGSDYDPETAAQIAQWQSAYMPRDSADANVGVKGHNAGRPGFNQGSGPAQAGVYPLAGAAQAASTNAGDAAVAAAAAAAAAAATSATGADQKKTVYREGGGKNWADDSLLEWDPSHLRLFVGNLAGETTNESLLKAFARWPSVQRAKVVRDKRTSKSKGYGFVSFSDPDDFFQAAKEMNGKYIQSHPVIVRKSTTEIKPQASRDERHHHRGKGGKGQKGGNKSGSGMGGAAAQADGMGGAGGASGYEAHLGPVSAGITKPGQKTKGGLRLLG